MSDPVFPCIINITAPVHQELLINWSKYNIYFSSPTVRVSSPGQDGLSKFIQALPSSDRDQLQFTDDSQMLVLTMYVSTAISIRSSSSIRNNLSNFFTIISLSQLFKSLLSIIIKAFYSLRQLKLIQHLSPYRNMGEGPNFATT